MGYFDAVTGRYFKTAGDGRKLFFPWGMLGRGYLLGSEREYQQLRHRLKIYSILGLVVITISAALQSAIAVIMAAVLLPAFYSVWVSRVLRGLQPSGEKLSWRESVTSQALAHGALALWSMEILSLAFIAMGVFILVIEPGKWLRALATIAFFGLCAGVFAFMLIVRRQRAVR